MLSGVLVGVKFTNARQILPSAQERPKESYAIDFWNPGSLDYVPVFRLNCGFESGEGIRPELANGDLTRTG